MEYIKKLKAKSEKRKWNPVERTHSPSVKG